LSEAFTELAEFWRQNVIPASQVKEEQSLRELSLPSEASTRLCFFAVPLSLLSFYRERVFPLVSKHGFVPVSADDVVSPGDTVLAKVEALIRRALLIVVDASSQNTLFEFGVALREKFDASRILLVTEPTSAAAFESHPLSVVVWPDVSVADPHEFLTQLDRWFARAAGRHKPLLLEEPTRLLAAREYRAAVIAAISLLEATLRQLLDVPKTLPGRRMTLTALLDDAKKHGYLADFSVRTVLDWLYIRNQIVHGQVAVNKATAEEIVNGVFKIIKEAD
jgi:hypothetical protein